MKQVLAQLRNLLSARPMTPWQLSRLRPFLRELQERGRVGCEDPILTTYSDVVSHAQRREFIVEREMACAGSGWLTEFVITDRGWAYAQTGDDALSALHSSRVQAA